MNKLIITIFIVIGIATAALAQTTEVCQPDTVVLFYDHSILEVGETMEFIMSYNDKGVLSKRRQYYSQQPFKYSKADTSPRFPIQSTIDYEYDQDINLVKMVEQYQGAPRHPTIYKDYVYEGGKLTLFVCHYEEIEEYFCSDSILYHYDAQQRLIHETEYSTANLILTKEICYSHSDSVAVKTTDGYTNGHWGAWVTLERKTLNFDENETLESVETEAYNQPTTMETYSYDGEGRVTNILTQALTDGEWVNTKLLEYIYDDNGHMILAEIKEWMDGEFVHANRAVYELNEAGFPVVVNFEKWNGEEWEQGTWKSGFYIFSAPYLDRQNTFLCRRDAKHIEIHYANTPLPTYDVHEQPVKQDFATLHPNPTTGQVTIMGQDLKAAVVFNTLGQQVARATGEGETLHIDIANLPAGVYFVNVTDGEGRKCVKKVVKE